MRKTTIYLLMVVLIALSCNKTNGIIDNAEENKSDLPKEVFNTLKSEGFSTNGVINVDSGYIVEGDIFFGKTYFEASKQPDLKEKAVKVAYNTHPSYDNSRELNNSDTDSYKNHITMQYRTRNLVHLAYGATSYITISVSNNIPNSYYASIDKAIDRYNNLGLSRLKFTRVSNNGQINIQAAPLSAGVLASSGFPNNGNPYPTIQMNVTTLGSSPDSGFLITTIAHEMGHCIGLRHTDFMNRNYSCVYSSPSNEGDNGDGALNIPGTSMDPEPNSFMLACSNGANRPFTQNDIAALKYLYSDGTGNVLPNGLYRITNLKSGLVLAASAGGTANGVKIIQWPWANVSNQKWQLIYVGNGLYKITNLNSGKVLAVPNNSFTQGVTLIQWTDLGLSANHGGQYWTLTSAGLNIFRITNINSGMVVAVREGATTNGAEIIQWPWINNGPQQWVLKAL